MAWDVKNSLHHVPLREAEKPLFCLQGLGCVLHCSTMPFGLKVPTFLWTKVCRPVVQQLHSEGFRIFVYIEDIGGAPQTQASGPETTADASRAANRVRTLLSDLGLILHPTKGELMGMTALPMLVFTVDSNQGGLRR